MDKPKFVANSVTIDLEDYQCEVTPSWKEPKKIHTSILTSKKIITYPNGHSTGTGRYTAEIIIWDSDGYLTNLEQDDVVDYYPYGDEGVHFNCIVNEYLPFKAEKDYTMINCCLIRLESEELVANPLVPATPVADPTTGNFATTVDVDLSCATSGAKIYYTTDGSEPTTSDNLYSTTLTFSATTTLKARAYMDDMPSRFSLVMTEVYTYVPV